MPSSASAERWRRDRRGASAIEFGIVGALLVLIIVAGMDLARYWFAAEAVRTFTAEVARAAQTCDPSVARTALLQGTGNCSTATLKTLALQRVTGLEPAQLSLSVMRAAVPNQPDRINVTITVIYNFDFVVRVFISPVQIRDETAIEI